jgi:hypothetical protein
LTVPRPSAQTSRRTGRKRFPRVGIEEQFKNIEALSDGNGLQHRKGIKPSRGCKRRKKEVTQKSVPFVSYING